MSQEEPKAPIVRIRKKKTKRKKRDSDVVILPVRASQNPRYASLSSPPNPQTKSRECCRHMFASCMKIPVCKLICFKCILPKCYSGTGSDDEECDVKDEGYHSQNRRSSEILQAPQAEGATGGATAEVEEVEMSEIKSEEVTLIPPPRTHVNDYGKDSAKPDARGRQCLNAESGQEDFEVNYIEVESISLHGENIPVNGNARDITLVKRPVSSKDSNAAFEKQLEVALEAKKSRYEHEYNDCDSDDESKHYVNEDVLKPKSEQMLNSSKDDTIVKVTEDKHYMNLDNLAPTNLSIVHSRNNSSASSDVTADDKPTHEYVNFKSPDDPEQKENILNESKRSSQSDEKIIEVSAKKENTDAETDVLNIELKVDLTPSLKSSDSNETAQNDQKAADDKLFQPEVVLLPAKVRNSVKAKLSSPSDKEASVNLVEICDSKKLIVTSAMTCSSDDTVSDTSDDETTDDHTGDQTKLI